LSFFFVRALFVRGAPPFGRRSSLDFRVGCSFPVNAPFWILAHFGPLTHSRMVFPIVFCFIPGGIPPSIVFQLSFPLFFFPDFGPGYCFFWAPSFSPRFFPDPRTSVPGHPHYFCPVSEVLGPLSVIPFLPFPRSPVSVRDALFPGWQPALFFPSNLGSFSMDADVGRMTVLIWCFFSFLAYFSSLGVPFSCLCLLLFLFLINRGPTVVVIGLSLGVYQESTQFPIFMDVWNTL